MNDISRHCNSKLLNLDLLLLSEDIQFLGHPDDEREQEVESKVPNIYKKGFDFTNRTVLFMEVSTFL